MSKYDRYDSVYHIKRAWLEALGGDPEGTLSDYDVSLRILDWYQSHSGGTCEHPINITMDVTKAISAYTGSMSWVYDKSTKKWYTKNNLNEYEEYGIMPTVEALSATTTYEGKLVILSGATPHEYEFVNSEWNDLGELDVKYGGEFDGNSWFDTGIQAKNNLCVEYDAVITGFTNNGGSLYGSRRGTSGANHSHGQFTDNTGLTSDLGSARNTAATNYKDKDLHYKGWLYTTGSSNANVTYGIYCTLDGDVSLSKTGTTTGANYTTGGNGYNMFVGAINNGGSVHQYKLKGKIKSFKIYENIDANGDGELTHDYTFVNDGGTVKMYDHITDTYFVNKGSGSVTLIPEWTPIKDYTEKDKPISSYSAETYCDLYNISSDIAYVGLYGSVDEDNYVINDEKKWEETSYPTIEYDGLILHANEAGSTVAMTNYGGNTPNLQYSFDGDTWENWDYSEIDLGLGQEVAFMGTNTKISQSSSKYSSFVITGNVDAKGDIMSLLDGGACTARTLSGDYCMKALFEGCDITTMPYLSATGLTSDCYHSMFENCTSLEITSELPTNLSIACYNAMFKNCTSLEIAPDLDSTVTQVFCYTDMFNGCTNLRYIKCMATNQASASMIGWVNNVASNGTFVKSTAAWWTTTGADGVPNGWTIEYSGQTEASVSTIAFNSGTSSSTFYVQTDTYKEYDWEIAEYPSWCTLDRTTKQGDRTAVKVTPQANNDDPRTGNIVITATDRIITIVVNQEGYGIEFENIYPAYSGTDRYWYVQYQQTQQDVNVKLGNQTKAWEITDYPDWVTVSPTAGTGNTLISLTATPNTVNNYREEFITVESGARQAKLRIMQYQYPVVLSNNLGNRAHSSSDDNEPKSHGNQWFALDVAVSGEVTTAGYDFVGMKSIVQRNDGWNTNPTAYIDTQWNRQKRPTITKFEIDASTIIQMEQAFSTGGGMYPSCTAFTITNCSGITKGLALSGLLSAVSISIGNLPASSSVGISFPQTTTLTDLSIGSAYANKNIILSGCTNLTVTSLVNVLNALPDNTGTSYNQKCVLGATNLAKLTAEQIAIGTNKGWTVQ